MLRKCLIGAALVILPATSVVADVEYSDNYLHRSDEMVRFDRAYRAGLSDGTTTIIYNEPKQGDEAGEGANGRPAIDAEVRPSAPAAERRESVVQNPCCAEDAQQEPDQSDSGLNSKLTAPRGAPVARSAPIEPEGELSLEERLKALEEARAKIRESRELYRQYAGHPDPSGMDQPATLDPSADCDCNEEPKYAPRLQPGKNVISADMAPLTPYELDPDFVRNQEINVEIPSGTIEEIAAAAMPRGWRVRVSSTDGELKEARFEFISSDARDKALRKLLHGTGLGFKYFFQLKDEQGNPSPLLLISDLNS